MAKHLLEIDDLSKNDLVKSIAAAFSEYEEYKKVKIDRYKKIGQLGENGKEGTGSK